MAYNPFQQGMFDGFQAAAAKLVVLKLSLLGFSAEGLGCRVWV